ncbi:MAG: phosphoheptose isomerase [Candidatus Marinimicrobia bacterium]|nr:phosphoheptose isomerase [Candidatus Neomarinimicrobiota bacterium]|tara:strand:+ start:48784 stop:49350 length:567 start_codon:yes stop_codon:yes gene_type:complete
MLNIKNIIESNISVKIKMIDTCIEVIEKAAFLMIQSIKNGNKILWCGNGGSAADAQHMAAELMGGLRSHDRKPIASIALTTDTSFITAWSNDTDYNTIFSRQIEGIGNSGDVLVAISTSGNSKNVIRAVNCARGKNINIITLLGNSKGKMIGMGDIEIVIPSNDTQRIQEGHLLTEHILCELVEEEFK